MKINTVLSCKLCGALYGIFSKNIVMYIPILVLIGGYFLDEEHKSNAMHVNLQKEGLDENIYYDVWNCKYSCRRSNL